MRDGLLPMNRQYVHLSSDIETAYQVGKRHGKVVILEIDCLDMQYDGYIFRISENDVWLVDKVPVVYLNIIKYGQELAT